MNWGKKARKNTMLFGLSAVITNALAIIACHTSVSIFSVNSSDYDSLLHILIPSQIKYAAPIHLKN